MTLSSSRLSRRRVYIATLITVNSVVILSLISFISRFGFGPTASFFLHHTSGTASRAIDYVHALEHSQPALVQASTKWTPLSLSRCLFGMPAHYAPCLARRLPNTPIYAEELVYPDFELREPYFPSGEAGHAQREAWRHLVYTDPELQRASLHGEWMSYKGQSGQNFVFADAKYTRDTPQDSWRAEACMSYLVNTNPIHALTPADFKDEKEKVFPTAIIASSPDSYSFQHFLDRVAHVIAQGKHLYPVTEEVYALTGRGAANTVNEMWAAMGFPSERVLHQSQTIAAERLVYSCRAVLVHPWLSLKTLEMLGVDAQQAAPLAERRKVVYMTRSDGQAHNTGRRVLNEEEVIAAIEALLMERQQGEELVVFDPRNFHNITALFSWFQQNVKAVVGPHGGAMINHRWAPKDTFILEFMPETRIALMIYEEASLLSQTYAAIVVPPANLSSYDMNVEVEQVVQLLRAHLGREDKEDPLRRSYSWGGADLGLR
ncbi:hypothetical protein MKEN_00448300 [Mycena kentingensis (nom. inval.)]|nr:hypothetical protein MKEN_00448300 [Mycena kentingensis (nom. inval.)]